MVHVGLPAPDFSCEAVVYPQKRMLLTLKDLGDQYKVIFFYPANFTYVCPTELHAFQARLGEFKKRNTAVIGVSVDTIESHEKWLATPKQEGGVQGVTYPLLSDACTKMCAHYGVLDEKSGKALRGLFILDRANTVQVALVQNMALGRNVDEVLRLLDALQFSESHGQVCPAQWTLEKPAMDPTHAGVVDYFKNHKDEQ